MTAAAANGEATYCPQCGQGYDDTAGWHRCPHCQGVQYPLSLPAPFGRLWTDLVAALPAIGIQEISWSCLPDPGQTATMAPSSWDPGPPPVLMLRLGRPDTETCLYLLHEMGHALLHPAGDPHDYEAYKRNPEPEERLVNAAADRVSNVYGIEDYNDLLTAMGHPFCEQGSASEEAVALAEDLIKLLRSEAGLR